MKTIITLLSLFLAAQAFANEPCVHDESNFRCVEYVKNYDGDTITFNVKGLHPLFGNKMKVRVSNVDTPEIRTKNKCEKEKAKASKKLVGQILKNAKRIDLVKVKKGKYFRVVADVMVEGVSLGKLLLKKGMAYKYDGGKKKKMDWCKSYRQIASEAE